MNFQSFMLIIARSRTLRWRIVLLEDVGSAAAVFRIVVLQKNELGMLCSIYCKTLLTFVK